MKEQIKQIIKDSHILVEGQCDTDVFVVVPLNDLATRLDKAIGIDREKLRECLEKFLITIYDNEEYSTEKEIEAITQSRPLKCEVK